MERCAVFTFKMMIFVVNMMNHLSGPLISIDFLLTFDCFSTDIDPFERLF